MDARRYSILRKTRKSFLIKNSIGVKDEKQKIDLRRESTVTFFENQRVDSNPPRHTQSGQVAEEIKLPTMEQTFIQVRRLDSNPITFQPT